MFGTSRISITDLSALSRRLATQLGAGVDMRRVWAREVENARSPMMRRRFLQVSDAVAHGQTLTEALQESGYFPALFCQLAEVGEQGGRSAEVFRQLANHYDHALQLRRAFRGAITWPVIQLCLALGIVGVLIWAMGFIAQLTGRPPMDILGFGLVGTSGLVVYLSFLAAVAASGFFIYQAFRRGKIWTRPLERFLLQIPQLGQALDTIALSRFAWSLFVTLESGMELRRALSLSLNSAHLTRYRDQIEPIWQSIRGGSELYEALGQTGVFPQSLVDAVEVGEQSGRLSETLSIVSEQYQDQARLAFGTLTIVAGFLVWAMVAGLIIMLIFRIFSSYINVINDAANGRF